VDLGAVQHFRVRVVCDLRACRVCRSVCAAKYVCVCVWLCVCVCVLAPTLFCACLCPTPQIPLPLHPPRVRVRVLCVHLPMCAHHAACLA
jgi:hypothetical protein